MSLIPSTTSLPYNSRHMHLLGNNNTFTLALLPELLFKILFKDQDPIRKDIHLVCKAVNAVLEDRIVKQLKMKVLASLPPPPNADDRTYLEATSTSTNKIIAIQQKIFPSLFDQIIRQRTKIDWVNGNPNNPLGNLKHMFIALGKGVHQYYFPSEPQTLTIVKIKDTQQNPKYEVRFEEEALRRGYLTHLETKAIKEAVSDRNQATSPQ